MMVEISSPDASAHFVKDIYPGAPGDLWRWTNTESIGEILAVQQLRT